MKPERHLQDTKQPLPVDDAGKLNKDEELLDDAEAAVEEALERAKSEEPSPLDELVDGPNVAIGIQTGQMARGAYSTDQATGAGSYHDHRSGIFGTDEVAQPGNDEEREPDEVDKGF